MTNGSPEAFVLRSGVRSGLKREFSWALKAHAEIPSSLSRTRSGRSPFLFSPPLPVQSKKPKTSDGQNTAGPLEPALIDDRDASVDEPSTAPEKMVFRRFTRSVFKAKKSPPSEDQAGSTVRIPVAIDELDVPELQTGATAEKPAEVPAMYESEPNQEGPADLDVKMGPLMEANVKENGTVLVVHNEIDGEDVRKMEAELQPEEPLVVKNKPEEPAMGKVQNGILVDSSVSENLIDGENGPEMGIELQPEKPIGVFASLDVRTEPEMSLATEVAEVVPLVDAGGPVILSPMDGQDGLRMDTGSQLEKPARRFTRSMLAPILDEPEIPLHAPTITVAGVSQVKPGANVPDKPERRFPRSLLKAEDGIKQEDEDGAEVNNLPEYPTKRVTRSVSKVIVDGTMDAVNGSPITTPKKKMELKMSKKITLKKLPSNIRELFATGLLEGLPVMYITCIGTQRGLQGVVKNDGILCSCKSCQGSKTISAYQFELHAGSTKKHPSDFIFLENGKSIHDVLRECSGVSLDMLESAIQKAIQLVSPKKAFTCQKCRGSFHTLRTMKFSLLCDSCLELKNLQKSFSPSKKACSSSRLSTMVLTPKSHDSKSKSSPMEGSYGRLTKKDVGLHKLVFAGNILPEGTQVGYFVKGKQLLEGYIKDSGIFCLCCSTVVSPSQFEAHAGRAQRRKPYNNIYTSNGVSLHELSVSLSKGRKLSASQNDDLCSICADGGDLILCDLCPRAFHPDCVGLSNIPKGDWYCRYCHNLHQRERCLESNANAIAAGRVAGIDPIEQIFKRCIRVVKTENSDIGGCVLCRCQDYTKRFGLRTVLICDQCEKEYHVGCLKEHNMADLKALPKSEWFCRVDCDQIYMALRDLLAQGPETLQGTDVDHIRRKQEERGFKKDSCADVRWRLLCGKNSSAETKSLLSKAVSIFHESFDPIIGVVTGRDLIPSMVYGRNSRDQDYGGMYCAVLTIGSSVVSAGILRVLGREVAELPLVATHTESQGQGYFRLLFSCIEKMLATLQVKHFVLPAADEAESIWINKFGFSKIPTEKLNEYTNGARLTVFQGTSMLHKTVPSSFTNHEN